MNRYFKGITVILVCAYFWYYAKTYTDWHFIDSVNLIFHEAGHWIFFFLGQWMKVLMGSGFQILLPFLISIYFFRTKQNLSASFCLLWVATNLLNVSIYAGDAIVEQLPLLGGDSVVHDWNYLLSASHMLNHTHTIGRLLYFSGLILLGVGSILAVYFSWSRSSAAAKSESW